MKDNDDIDIYEMPLFDPEIYYGKIMIRDYGMFENNESVKPEKTPNGKKEKEEK